MTFFSGIVWLTGTAGLLAGALAGQTANPALTAREAFDLVDAAPRPSLDQAQRCVQAHALLSGLVRSQQSYLVHYRTGYCELFAALASGDSQRYQKAARDFTHAIAAWPFGGRETAPLGLRILPLISRMERGRMAGSFPDSQAQFTALIGEAACADTPVMDASFCQSLVDTARVWIAWLSMQREAWAEVGERFALAPAVPLSPTAQAWRDWAEGQRLLQERKTGEAMRVLAPAVKALAAQIASAYPDPTALFGPRPELAEMHYHVGTILTDGGLHDQAIECFDAALAARPEYARAMFQRARARERLDLGPAALEDYAQAIRLAQQTNDTTWAIGDAFFRRGLLHYRGGRFAEARGEFANAMGNPVAEISRADLTAWRVLAAVAGGDCLAAGVLETSTRAASDSFPKKEALARAFDCRFKEVKGLDALLAIEKNAGDLPMDRQQSLRARIAVEYADRGVAAEDKSDVAAATAAYQKAISYDPANAKARFNLGAIFLDRKQFAQAETQFRALVQSHPQDYEALYWLGESVLAQDPSPSRRAEACGYLQRSLTVADPERRKQFQSVFDQARCSR